MTLAHEIFTQHGQSFWLDYIRRNMLHDGGMAEYIARGVRGVTSNPTIFEKAITQSDDYDDQLRPLYEQGASPDAIFEALAIQDIQHAADLMLPLYDDSDGGDGFVSLEVSPRLAHDTEGTIREARRFWEAVERPNLMIKVPATPEGIPAFQTLISEGINVNVTLMFSLAQYDAVSEAYLAGLEALHAAGGAVAEVASVASFFVSRVDAQVDSLLPEDNPLRGRIAIANACAAYARSAEVYSGPRWETLRAVGASLQRLLWASTSTKNPAYPDTLYVDALIGPATVNTLPPETFEAALDHATVARTLGTDPQGAQADLAALAEAGVDLDAVTDDLLTEGVEKFAASFDSLLAGIEEKCQRLPA